MLVLTRKVGEQIVIGDNVTVVVNRVAGNRISLGIQAPPEVRIIRGELQEAVKSFEDDRTGASPAPLGLPGVPTLHVVGEMVAHRAR